MKEKLAYFKEMFLRDLEAYEDELRKIDRREALYRGTREMDSGRQAIHVRNIVSEMIESQVKAEIPRPHVTPLSPEDGALAKKIEDMLVCEMDRLPFEEMNDMMERTVPLQGAGFFLVEWDGEKGELAVRTLHPGQVIPEAGVFGPPDDMDHITLRLTLTAESVNRLYGVSVEPEEGQTVTEYVTYYKNGGVIGRFSWVGDTVLEDLGDYQARACGDRLYFPGKKSDGTFVPGFSVSADGSEMAPNDLPLFRPGGYPIIMQKNVSLYGSFLGDSDADKIADQQNTIKRLSSKVDEKLMKAGSYMTLPNDATIRCDGEDMKVIRPGTPANKAMIDVYNMQADISGDLTYMARVYEESREIIGITDSYQGREDSTALSGTAKQFSAAQAAGRLQSKAVLKNAAYARLFEKMFRFMLAYGDRPRVLISGKGEGSGGLFSRYDFLTDGGFNDRFLFSADDASLSGQDRQSLWKENRRNLETGAYGPINEIKTLVLFWRRMEELHYPGAAGVISALEDREKEEKQ